MTKSFFKSISLSTNTSKRTVVNPNPMLRVKQRIQSKKIQPNNKKGQIQNPICILVPAGLMILLHFCKSLITTIKASNKLMKPIAFRLEHVNDKIQT